MKYILYLLFNLLLVNSQQKFNVFKSYADSKNKPPQYSKKNLRHSIKEYLDTRQQKMLEIRNSPDQPNMMFDSKWSGFDLEENKNSALK
jgi:hypothetical protein